MAFNTSNFTGALFGLFRTGFFWFILIALMFLVTIGFLWIRKNKKISIQGIEVTEIGDDRVSFNTGRAFNGGWFKHNTTFFGLYDYGKEYKFKIRDGREVTGVSSTDFQELNGKTCLIYMRSPTDPRILVPLNRVTTLNKSLLLKIAPVELRSSAVDIIQSAEKETADRTSEIIQKVIWGLLIVFTFITIVIIIQMVKNGQTEAKDLILEAGKLNKENLQAICQGIRTVGESVASTTAP